VNPRELAEHWLERFNARDLDGLLGLYAGDAVHHSPKLRAQRPESGGRIAGKDAMRAWWADAFERLPGLRYRRIALTADADRAVLEYSRELPNEAPMPIAEVFVCKGGQITESFVFHG
jgi:ketosteroid isomerase-like protein